MAQFTAYENSNQVTKKTYPYLLDIQSNLLDELRTTVVIPLMPVAVVGNTVISKLCPVVEIENKKYVALTQQLAGIEKKLLGAEVCDLSQYQTEIISALDFIISSI